MRLAQGNQKLTETSNYDLVIDWDKLWYYRGNMLTAVSIERSLGNVLLLLGVGFTILGLALPIFAGNITNLTSFVVGSPTALILSLGLFLLTYAQYLRRDRLQFSFRKGNKSLHQLANKITTQKREIYLDQYISYPVWALFEYAYFHNPDNFLVDVMQQMLASKDVKQVFNRLALNSGHIQELVNSLSQINPRFDQHIPLFTHAFQKALDLELEQVDEVAFVTVLIDHLWVGKLQSFGVTNADLQGLYLWLRNRNRRQRYYNDWKYRSLLKPQGVMNRAYTSRIAETLEKYGEDYTRAATRGAFVLSIGKEEQMRQMLKILQKQNGSACVVVGDPGVGKSTFLRHFGTRMVVEDVPGSLKDQRLVAFDFNRAFTNSQRFEDFKQILQSILDETAAAGNIVLILDNLDQILNIRADLQAEVVNLLVNGIDRYGLRLVGTASTDGYNRFIKPLPNLAALFVPIFLPEPQPEVALQILIDEADKLEKKHGISIQVPALKQIVTLAPKFAYERVMPDKAIDLLEEALLDAKEKGLQQLTADVVNDLVSRKVGVNVGRISESESQVLMKLEERMHGRVIGQQEAIKAVANALRRTRAGLQKAAKPIAAFLFFGPTGVGKTEVAKTLAETYYGDEKMMIRLDMSEFQEEKNLERLIGYQENGKFMGGYLTEAVRQKPFSLVLFDEIEKANPKVLDLFLQLLDEGYITDGGGRKVDFTNTIIIATTNAGSRQIALEVAAGKSYQQVYTVAEESLKQVFRVEFLNRFSKLIMFKSLVPVEVEQIAVLMLNKLNKQLHERGYALEYNAEAVQRLVRLGFDPIYGARQMQRVIQEEVEDRIAEAVVTGQLKPGGVFSL
jgi:ATP-dependent Clp protease ATP-binding subunit ClpC